MTKKADTVCEASFGDAKDRAFATLQIGVAAAFLTDYAFTLYLLPPADWIWAILALPAAVLLVRLGHAVQAALAKRLQWDKPEYDPEKSLREYFKFSRSLLTLLISLSIGAAFFAIAFGIRQLNYALVDHDTIAHVTGYIYETLAAFCGILTFYFGAIMWFFPDDILFAGDINPIVYAAVPGLIGVVFVVLIGVPFYAALLYLAVYYLLLLARKKRISKYEKMLKKQQQLEEEAKYKSRWE